MDVAALLAGIYPDTLPGYLAIEISVIPDAVKLRAAVAAVLAEDRC
jgi:hypothetical protein